MKIRKALALMLTPVMLLGMVQTAVFALAEPVTTWTELKAAAEQAAADQAAADAVELKITAIGEVEYTAESKAMIDDARGAYNALTESQKELVENYATLTAAETRYAELKAAPENENPDQPTDPTNPTDPTDSTDPTDPTDPSTPDTNAGSYPLCGEEHGNNIGMKVIHLVIYWLTWLFRDWLPGFYK